MTALLDRIVIDPQVCFGRPCIRGTRIWVSLILDFLASGESEAQILAAYPQLQADDICAALAYAAEVARERIVPVPTAAAGRSASSTRTSARSASHCCWPRVTT